MNADIELMRRAAKIAGNTKCWIGIGCVIAKGGKILVETWNETLEGEEYCQKFRNHRINKGPALQHKAGPYHNNEGCIRHELKLSGGKDAEKVCSIHAEVNAIAKAARQGIVVSGATIYVTSFPCLICMRAIVAAGIKKVVYMNDFYKPHNIELFDKNGVEFKQIPENIVWK
ncbi:hypothetical protein HZB78_00500 [Candidatus Collierbacteria bacterium]|nr:hypothetical protein [Candidatus Collierbacteria bacterium]